MNNPFFYYDPTPIINYSRQASDLKDEPLEHPEFLTPGDTAPGFTLEGIINGQPREVSLPDYRGKWVVLFFYSSDFTFV